MTNEEMMGLLAQKNPCADPPGMNFDPDNPTLLAQGEEATLDVIGGLPPYTFEILQTSLFYLDDAYIAWPPGYSDTYIKASSYWDADTQPWFAADPALPRHGASWDNSWYSSAGNLTNQRWNIDLGSFKTVKQILIENHHDSGGDRDRGIKNFVLQGSNDGNALAQVDYSSDQYWTDIATGLQAAQHIVGIYDDPQLFDIDNDTAYRYYSLKIADNWGGADFMILRHVQFHTADDQVYKFITNDPQITITAPSFALWTVRVKVTDLCGTEDSGFLYTSEGKWQLVDNWTAAGEPHLCGGGDFRLIKNGCMHEGISCNDNGIGPTGPYPLDCSAYGGGSYDITIQGACGGGGGCDRVKWFNQYCWPFP